MTHRVIDLDDTMSCVRVEVRASGVVIWTMGDVVRAFAGYEGCGWWS